MTYDEFIKIFGDSPFVMVKKGYQFTDPEILRLATDYGTTVAHQMAYRGYKFTDPEILKLVDKYGIIVAHEMAWKGHKFTDPEILRLTDRDFVSVEAIMNQ